MILISNDDGYQAPGIDALAKALGEIDDITVVAPDRNRSGAGHSLTLDIPIRAKKVRDNWYYTTGTPTDCVHLAATELMKVKPDMVVSGINRGENMGDDVMYSGTVAAAFEGRFLGMPSIAISLAGQPPECRYYETAAAIAKSLVLRLRQHPLPLKMILNVNVPDVPLAEIKGYEVTRTGTRHVVQTIIKQYDPHGEEVYWKGESGPAEDAGIGTDFHAVRRGYVSITPLKLDWTDYNLFDQLVSWII